MNKYGFSAPHFLASQSGNAILSQGGSAIDAMVAAAATIAVVYPHMNSLGGDGFWLIQRKGEKPIAIDASGRSAGLSNVEQYAEVMPSRGESACITQAGTVSGWQLARDYLQQWQEPISLDVLFADAISHCENGVVVTQSLIDASNKILKENVVGESFKQIYTDAGHSLKVGDTITNPQLASLFKKLANNGLMDFYQGEVAQIIAAFFAQSDSPLTLTDFLEHTASYVEPLHVKTSQGTLYNLPAPTQGMASLLILAIYDRLYQSSWTSMEQVHYLVEATKQAFLLRDDLLTDPDFMQQDLAILLSDDKITEFAESISAQNVMPWPKVAEPGDTVWMGAIDAEGTVVSFIQSVYWEFGSGVVIPELGLVWNNRGVSFSLDQSEANYLQPNKKPKHTLNPAMAELHDGRRLVYGTMGGEGQPQTQAAVFNYFQYQQKSLKEAIASPRWLLGRTWGDASQNLKIEKALSDDIGESLQDLGHDIESVADCNEMMGHAGAVLVTADNEVETAVDPRSDG